MEESPLQLTSLTLPTQALPSHPLQALDMLSLLGKAPDTLPGGKAKHTLGRSRLEEGNLGGGREERFPPDPTTHLPHGNPSPEHQGADRSCIPQPSQSGLHPWPLDLETSAATAINQTCSPVQVRCPGGLIHNSWWLCVVSLVS